MKRLLIVCTTLLSIIPLQAKIVFALRLEREGNQPVILLADDNNEKLKSNKFSDENCDLAPILNKHELTVVLEYPVNPDEQEEIRSYLQESEKHQDSEDESENIGMLIIIGNSLLHSKQPGSVVCTDMLTSVFKNLFFWIYEHQHALRTMGPNYALSIVPSKQTILQEITTRSFRALDECCLKLHNEKLMREKVTQALNQLISKLKRVTAIDVADNALIAFKSKKKHGEKYTTAIHNLFLHEPLYSAVLLDPCGNLDQEFMYDTFDDWSLEGGAFDLYASESKSTGESDESVNFDEMLTNFISQLTLDEDGTVVLPKMTDEILHGLKQFYGLNAQDFTKLLKHNKAAQFVDKFLTKRCTDRMTGSELRINRMLFDEVAEKLSFIIDDVSLYQILNSKHPVVVYNSAAHICSIVEQLEAQKYTVKKCINEEGFAECRRISAQAKEKLETESSHLSENRGVTAEQVEKLLAGF